MEKISTQWQSKPIYPKGIICGSDQAQEWLLPWWWSRLRDHNQDPVAFCDFGMSSEALQWCRERGEVIPVLFDQNRVVSKEAVASHLGAEWVQQWEELYSSVIWDFRHVWFKKPFALLHSPFQRTIWLDLDCEVLAPLQPLFELCSTEAQLGIMREFRSNFLPHFHPDILYNSGVIVFEHGASLIEKWAEGCMSLTDQFVGDEQLLSHLINTLQIPVKELPDVFNWRASAADWINLHAVIWHWVCPAGKEYIRQHGGFKPILEKFLNIGSQGWNK